MAQQVTKKDTEEVEHKYTDIPDDPKDSKPFKRMSMEGALKAARISLEKYVNPQVLHRDKLIPKKILKNAKGIVFLTCIKGGFLFAGNIGVGCVIVRNTNIMSNESNYTVTGWSPPSAIGVAGVSFGFLAGGAKVDYLFILNDDYAVKQFTGAGQLRLGGEAQLALGPIGRDADASLGVGDGGVSAIYSYSHTQGLYGGLEMKGKIITVRPRVNAKFYRQKGVKCGDILAGNIRMPKNNDYDRIVHLLDTYCLDHVFPQQLTQQVDLERMMKLNDVNIENAVSSLQAVFPDVDKEVIRIVLMEQCWGDLEHATDILLKMSKTNASKHSVEQKIEEYDIDVVKRDVKDKQEITEVAEKVKDAVIKQGKIQSEAAFDCYEVLSGRCVSRAVESYQVELETTSSNRKVEKVQTVQDLKYRIKVKIGELESGQPRCCELLVYKTNPPLKYQLVNVEFGIGEHEEEQKQSTLNLVPFSSNKLKKMARTHTKRHLDLSDDDDDDMEEYDNKNCPIASTINANTMDNDDGNGAQAVLMLDNLVKSFEKK